MTMEFEIKGRDMQVDDDLHADITSKLERLGRYLNGILTTRVELSHSAAARQAEDRFVAQITVSGKGFALRAEERGPEPMSAFDVAFDNIKRRVRRYKEKSQRGAGDRTSIGEAALEDWLEENPAEQEAEPVIVRRKHFFLQPMDEAEAIEQSKLLGHENFFVFFNMNTNSVNVLYQRRDGAYGLIETELA